MNPELIGWAGNVFIFAGLATVAYKLRLGFIFGIIGNTIWLAKGVYTGQHDLIAVELIVVILQAFSWWKWGHERTRTTVPGTSQGRSFG